jgi:hypothetical protein
MLRPDGSDLAPDLLASAHCHTSTCAAGPHGHAVPDKAARQRTGQVPGQRQPGPQPSPPVRPAWRLREPAAYPVGWSLNLRDLQAGRTAPQIRATNGKARCANPAPSCPFSHVIVLWSIRPTGRLAAHY